MNELTVFLSILPIVLWLVVTVYFQSKNYKAQMDDEKFLRDYHANFHDRAKKAWTEANPDLIHEE